MLILIVQDNVAFHAAVKSVSIVFQPGNIDANHLSCKYQLIPILCHHPCLLVQLHIGFVLDRTDFQKIVVGLASMYRNMWDEVKDGFKKVGNVSFFEVDCVLRDPSGRVSPYEQPISLKGRLQHVRATGICSINITEYNSATKRETTILDQPFMQGRKRM